MKLLPSACVVPSKVPHAHAWPRAARPGLRRRAVDFVGQEKVARKYPRVGRELPGLEIVDVRSDDIARHQVGVNWMRP
jgi:hypothetical protein